MHTKEAQVSVPASLLGDVVKYVEVSSLLAKKALDEVEAHELLRKKAEATRPTVLGRLVELGLVSHERKQAADAMLVNHAETMALLKMAAERIAEVTAKCTELEKQAAQKTAATPGAADDGPHEKLAYDSLRDPVVGAPTQRVRESDKALLALAGR